MISTSFTRKSLQLGISSAALLIGMAAAPAFAQVSGTTVPDSTQATGSNGQQTPGAVALEDQRDQNTALNPAQDAAQGDVVVTGSLFRGAAETPSPVTTLTAANLDQRGITTVTDAIQRLSANGAGTLPNSFSANGAFAAGASAPSLRGLTTASTLVLFDGLRAAYYPLADDGVRNFVDTNSIPIAIVDHVDVLKDGASSTYGADAVAGVINIITKKQITGLRINGQSGISQQGDSGERRIDATFGYGDLSENKFNVYASVEFQKNDPLFGRDRGYPYNTSDLSRLCATTSAGTQACRTNNISNGTQYDGTYAGLGTTLVNVVRPYNGANTTAVTGSRYTLLNPAAGCRNLTPTTLTAAQAASTAGATAALTNCLYDPRQLYNVIAPSQERVGFSSRATVQINDTTQAYGAFNFYQSDVYYTGAPSAYRNNTPAGGTQFSTTTLALPVYVCPRNGANAVSTNGVPVTPGCTAANGTLNPNNPYAALGQTARVIGLASDIPVSNERRARVYRGALGIDGNLGYGVDYTIEGTYMRETLRATYNGYLNVQNLLNVVADGSYNFINPASNSQATRDYLAPVKVNRSVSELGQVQATFRKQFFDLPGGPLGVAIGGSFRYESVFAPSANPVVPGDTLGVNRTFVINGFGTSGSRGVGSGFFQIDAPIISQFFLSGSGRYDSYSSGQHNFSPKIGGKFTPIKQVSLVATYSKGFRIPSFAEAYGLPTTGYVQATPPASYTNQCANPRPAYCTSQYSLGTTSIGNPNLRPEKSTNFTAGVIVNPVSNVSIRFDYYNIYKKDLITGANYSPQVDAYYASNGNVTGFTPGITGLTVDTPGFSNLAPGSAPYPLLSTVEYGFINANSAKSTGFDLDVETSLRITPWLKWTGTFDGNYVLELSQTIDGEKQDYAGSLGPYQTTSASGTPRWRLTVQNTFDFGRFSLTGTTYYTSGYREGAADSGNTPNGSGCGPNAAGSYGSYTVYRDNANTAFNEGTTVVTCRVKHFIDVDLTGQLKINDQFTLTGSVLNVLGVSAPYDPSTYGAGSGSNAGNYNPAWANAGIIGRYFRVGAKVKF